MVRSLFLILTLATLMPLGFGQNPIVLYTNTYDDGALETPRPISQAQPTHNLDLRPDRVSPMSAGKLL